MKVLCITSTDSQWQSDITGKIINGPKCGDICTVIGETGEDYLLQEWNDPDDQEGWHKSQFVPMDGGEELVEENAEQQLATV